MRRTMRLDHELLSSSKSSDCYPSADLAEVYLKYPCHPRSAAGCETSVCFRPVDASKFYAQPRRGTLSQYYTLG